MEISDFVDQLFEKRSKSGDTGISPPRPSAGHATAAINVLPESSRDAIPCSRDANKDAYEQTKRLTHGRIVERINADELNKLDEDRRRIDLRALVESLVDSEPCPLTPTQRRVMVEELLDEMLGFGPLEPLLRDPSIGDILINGTWGMYVEQGGVLHEVPNLFRDADHLLEIVQRIVSRVGRRVNESSPMVDARLPDGSRFHAVISPLALNGPLVSIRRFGVHPLTFADLLHKKSLTSEMGRFLQGAVRAKLNIIVSGGTGSGKTTLLNALSAFIPNTERIITIEDAAELQLQQRHVGKLEARPANLEGKGEVTIRDLVRTALRMRPDRIVVGECRGAEALDMLQAMNTGHDGSLTTLHANCPRDALTRLETMIMFAGLDLPLSAMRQQIAGSINLIVQIERLIGGARRISRISEVVGMERDIISLQDLFVFSQQGVDAAGKAIGRFEATGISSHYEAKLIAAGVHLPHDIFRQRVLLEI